MLEQPPWMQAIGIAVIPLHIPPLCERPSDIKLLTEHFLQQLAKRDGTSKQEFSHEALRLFLGYTWPGNVRELANAVEHGVICASDGVVEPRDLPFEIRRSVESLDVVPEPVENDDYQRQSILEILKQTDGNRTLAAKLLGVDRTTLWRRMRRLGLD